MSHTSTSQPSSSLTRRAALQLAAASAALSACAPMRSSTSKHVAVIGGGIIGASIAYHLTKAGAQVTILERGGLAERASRGTFAWINATWAKQPRHYHAFSQAGVAGWAGLQSELDIPIQWGGSLEWFASPARQDRLANDIAEQIAWHEPAEMISPEKCAELEPHVDFGGAKRIAFSANDGALDPVLATNILIKAALESGATLKLNCAVERAEPAHSGGAVLHTNCGPLSVDQFVLATGADPEAPKTLARVNIPQRTTPGVIVITRPQPRLINRIIVAPGVHIHQRADGRIVLGEQDGAPDTESHMERLRGRPTKFPAPEFATQHAQRILAIAESFVPSIAASDIEDVFIGWRPLPLDGHPVLGISPNQPAAYLAIMHSGVSLAPIVGELAAKEIMTRQTAPDLDPYRPNRNFEQANGY